jgi:hypothetical protein
VIDALRRPDERRRATHGAGEMARVDGYCVTTFPAMWPCAQLNSS